MDQGVYSNEEYSSQLQSCAMSETTTTNGEAQRKRKAELLPDVEYSQQEEYKRMMASLSRDQLMDILCRSVATHADVRATALNIVEKSPASRRLMIRNISFATTEAALREIFVKYGEIEDFTICKDRATGKSRGFGFVTYTTIDAVKSVMSEAVEVDGRTLQIKLATDPVGDQRTDQRPETGVSLAGELSQCKIFVRNLSDTTTEMCLRKEFDGYGSINEAVVVTRNANSKGYGFVTFSSPEDAYKAREMPQRVINGQMAFVSAAAPSSGRSMGKGPVVAGGGGGYHQSAYNQGMAVAQHRQQMAPHMNAAPMQAQMTPQQQQYQYPSSYGPTIIQTPSSMYPQQAQPSLYNPQQQSGVGMAVYGQVGGQGCGMMGNKVAHAAMY